MYAEAVSGPDGIASGADAALAANMPLIAIHRRCRRDRRRVAHRSTRHRSSKASYRRLPDDGRHKMVVNCLDSIAVMVLGTECDRNHVWRRCLEPAVCMRAANSQSRRRDYGRNGRGGYGGSKVGFQIGDEVREGRRIGVVTDVGTMLIQVKTIEGISRVACPWELVKIPSSYERQGSRTGRRRDHEASGGRSAQYT